MPKITISSRLSGGHRRAGRFIPDGPTELDVTDAELARFRADKQIVLLEAEPKAAPKAAPKAESKK